MRYVKLNLSPWSLFVAGLLPILFRNFQRPLKHGMLRAYAHIIRSSLNIWRNYNPARSQIVRDAFVHLAVNSGLEDDIHSTGSYAMSSLSLSRKAKYFGRDHCDSFGVCIWKLQGNQNQGYTIALTIETVRFYNGMDSYWLCNFNCYNECKPTDGDISVSNNIPICGWRSNQCPPSLLHCLTGLAVSFLKNNWSLARKT